VRGRSDSSESIQTGPSQGPHVSVLLHHCHQLLNELFLSAAGRPEACSPEQFNAPGSDPLLLGVPVVLLTLQIAGVLTREDVAVAKSMSAMVSRYQWRHGPAGYHHHPQSAPGNGRRRGSARLLHTAVSFTPYCCDNRWPGVNRAPAVRQEH